MTDITSPSMEYRIYSSDWSTVLVLRELLYCKLELTISTVEVGWLGRSAVGSGAGTVVVLVGCEPRYHVRNTYTWTWYERRCDAFSFCSVNISDAPATGIWPSVEPKVKFHQASPRRDSFFHPRDTPPAAAI